MIASEEVTRDTWLARVKKLSKDFNRILGEWDAFPSDSIRVGDDEIIATWNSCNDISNKALFDFSYVSARIEENKTISDLHITDEDLFDILKIGETG